MTRRERDILLQEAVLEYGSASRQWGMSLKGHDDLYALHDRILSCALGRVLCLLHQNRDTAVPIASLAPETSR